MSKSTRLKSILVASLLLLPALLTACSGGPEKTMLVPETRSSHGQSCEVQNDCEEHLSCVNQTCIRDEYAISASAKQCQTVECLEDSHCCDSDSGNCPLACEDYQCVTSCSSDNECPPNQLCDDDAGRCVGCLGDDDCSDGFRCADNNTCVEECTVDANCPLFNECQSGECVETGCQTDRECKLFSEDGEAVCGDNGECIVPCRNDAECNSYDNSGFQVCEKGRCVFAGCQTDRECRAVLNVANQDRRVKAVCGNPDNANLTESELGYGDNSGNSSTGNSSTGNSNSGNGNNGSTGDGQVGDTCESGSDCASGTCMPTGNGYDICTEDCSDSGSCEHGGSCYDIAGQSLCFQSCDSGAIDPGCDQPLSCRDNDAGQFCL